MPEEPRIDWRKQDISKPQTLHLPPRTRKQAEVFGKSSNGGRADQRHPVHEYPSYPPLARAGRNLSHTACSR